MKIMRKTAARVFAYFIFVLISLVALGGVASAQGPSNGYYNKDVNDAQVPQWVTAPDPNEPYSGRCTDSNGVDWSAGQAAWISTQNGAWFNQQSVTVAAGTTSVPLNVVFANTWCRSSVYNVIATFNLIESVTATEGATVSGIAANTVIAAGQTSNPYNSSPSWGAVAVAALPFNLNLPANLSPGLHNIVVKLNQGKKINRAVRTTDNYNYWQCVKNSPSVYPAGIAPSDFAPCLTDLAELVVSITVPQTNYIGTVQTNKRLASDSSLTSDPTVSGANITLSHSGQGCNSWSESSTAQSWQKALWVNPCSSTVSTQGDYNNSIDVPTGYKLNRVQLSGGDTDLVSTVCTDNTNKTGTCVAYGVRVVNGTYTFVDWFLEKIPATLNVSCTSDSGEIGGKITVTASSPLGTSPVAILEDIDINPPTATRNITGSYSFDITSKYRDGGVHTYYATYDGLSKSVTFGPGQACNIDKWFYPWLQTSQGDVVADGKIEGQTTSTGTAGTLGARLDNATAKEAEFLVISAVADGGPFCSTYKYILTNTSSQGTNCGNGAGYNFNSTGIDNDTVDRVIGGVKQAFADNGGASATTAPSACSTNNQISVASVTTLPTSISTTCSGGIIYKMPGNSSIGLKDVSKGRVTIYVEGDLNITGYLNSTGGSQQQNPLNASNLAVVATGKINIVSTMKILNAQLYAGGKINTCTTSTGAAATPNDCSVNQLTVRGSMSAKGGFDFKRTYIYGVTSGTISTCTASPTTAPLVFPTAAVTDTCASELITLNPQSIAFPPPGLDSRYFYNNFSSYKLDSAEYNPRF
jgi:hypothetical protein